MNANQPISSFNRRNFIRVSAVTGLGLSLNLYSCTKKDITPPPKEEPNDDKIKITDISIDLFIDAKEGGDIAIQGKGFEEGDKIIFESQTDSSTKHTLDIKSITETHAIVTLPMAMLADKYRIVASRGTSSVTLGSTTLSFIINDNIPDKAGMTVKGIVHVAGVGMANVVVSDGFEVTKTDDKGIYYLPSKKKSGYVFVSIPGNHEVENQGSAPMFYNRVTRPASTVEVKDFALTPANNEKHVLLALGDMHLANRNNDIEQFQKGFLVDVNKTIDSFKSAGTKVYAMTLGDMTWDTYWYNLRYFPQNFRSQMNDIKTTVFTAIGNHDNDPQISDDWFSENKFREALGPTYYSFNLGKVHYVVLDNIEYSSSSSYRGKIVADQMAWFKKDLATIEDKSTPIVIVMHIQLNNEPSLNADGTQKSTLRLDNSTEFINAVSGFSTVHVITGHTHKNYNVENSPSLMEHNTGAVCATWWWTGRNGYAGNQICKDGSPGGYGVWQIDDKELDWYYKSIGYEKDYQFRAYDLNKVHITKEAHAPSYTGSAWNNYAAEYANANNNNEVLINVFNYDTKWKVEVTENGQPLTMTRVFVQDPLHIISYSAKRLNVNAVPTKSFVTQPTAHMFKAKADSPTSTLQIKVTDRFGNVYTETMERPKAFTYLMR